MSTIRRFNLEQLVGWSLSVVLLGAVVWSVSGFVSGPAETRRTAAEPTTFSMEELAELTDVEAASSAISRPSRDPASPDAVAGPFTFGDDASLDGLWQECEAGDGVACDRLFEVSPVGSDYERFGLTCGDRPLVLDCSAELSES